MSFDESVFVNCPFDEKYYPLLRPLLFTVIYLGFTPRMTLQSLDSGKPRIQKIIALIKGSAYAIHDLSRVKAERKGEYFRLNMPFELGLDVGCRVYKVGKWSRKKCLILETERYRYQVAISDVSNSDITAHHNEPEQVVVAVRNWLNNAAHLSAHGPNRVWGAFNDFMADNYDALKKRGFSDDDIRELGVSELIDCMKKWVRKKKIDGRS
jgi:hypothetical protein